MFLEGTVKGWNWINKNIDIKYKDGIGEGSFDQFDFDEDGNETKTTYRGTFISFDGEIDELHGYGLHIENEDNKWEQMFNRNNGEMYLNEYNEVKGY